MIQKQVLLSPWSPDGERQERVGKSRGRDPGASPCGQSHRWTQLTRIFVLRSLISGVCLGLYWLEVSPK